MKTHAVRSMLINALGVALALASGPAWAITYRLTDLGTLGGSESQGVALNASGQATGFSTTAGGETHAFLWDGTTMLDLGTLGGTDSRGVNINDSGQVTGSSDTTDVPFEARHAFLWDGTTMQDLGTLGGRI
jgi:probable HAF family extracellular repeat protein